LIGKLARSRRLQIQMVAGVTELLPTSASNSLDEVEAPRSSGSLSLASECIRHTEFSMSSRVRLQARAARGASLCK